MIRFMRNIFVVLIMTKISTVVSTSNPPPQPYRYSTYTKCKDAMEEVFGEIQNITPLQCLKTAITNISKHDSIDPDVESYLKTFFGKYDSSKIKLPKDFCDDTILDMFRNAETSRLNILNEIDSSRRQCQRAIYCFGSKHDTILTKALIDHKQGLVWYYNCEYFHQKDSFGWKYLDHIKENVNALKVGIVDDLVTPIKHCQKLHPPETREKKEKKPPAKKFEMKENPKDKASSSGSTKKKKK